MSDNFDRIILLLVHLFLKYVIWINNAGIISS